MAIYGNSDLVNFCYWMLNVSWQKLTPPRQLLIQDVYQLALDNDPIPELTFNNFTQVTAWRYKYYLVWKSTQSNLLPETEAYFNALPFEETESFRQVINNYINELINSGCWANLDYIGLGCVGASGNIGYSLKNTTNFTPSVVGNLLFQSYRGVTGSSGSIYVNSGYNPTSFGGLMSQNSASIGIYCRTQLTNTFQEINHLSGSTIMRLFPQYTGTQAYAHINQTSTGGVMSSSVSTRTIQANRTASNLITLYRDGSSVATNTEASTGLVNANLAWASGGRSIALAFFGNGSLSASAMATANNNLANTLNFNV